MLEKTPSFIESGPEFKTLGLVHRVLTPEGPGPFPTVVMIHGRKGTEDVMWIFARTIPKEWQIISIRAIYEEEDGYSWNKPLGRFPTLEEMEEGATAVARFIEQLPHIYPANPNKIYLMGFSQGAAVSFATAVKHQGLVQGVAGLVGFVPEMNDAILAQAPLKDLPVFMAVGEKDDTIPLEVARASGEALRALGAWLEYREYPTGHKLNGAGMRKLQAWWEMVAQS